MNKWISIVNKHRAAKNVIPEGWLTRAQVASQLGLHNEKRVNEVLRAALDAGDIEADSFPVWDKIKKRVVSVACFRITGDSEAPKKKKTPPAESPTPKQPIVGGRVRHRISGQVGVFEKEGKQWKIVWPHTRPSFPGERAFSRDLEIL
jgi:hypothetical protein